MTPSNPRARPLVVFGCGGHGRVSADMARAAGRDVAGFLDDDPGAPPVVDGVRVLGRSRLLDDRSFVHEHEFLVGIGDCAIRRALSEKILAKGGTLGTVVHPSAVLAGDVEVGAGALVVAGAIANVGSRIGRFAVINTGATVDHDNSIADGVHISPGCHLSGHVTCEEDAFLGTGASVIPGIRIGRGAYVAAGAVVVDDVEPGVLVAGVPAVFKKRLKPAGDR